MNNHVSLEQIDRLLADWQSNIARASANLLDLDSMLTYKRLRGCEGLPPAKLMGATQARVAPALTAIDALWQNLPLLTDVIDRAAALRKSLPKLWAPESSLQTIEDLLTGPSIRLPATQTPLAQRGLLTASEEANAMTPQRLLTVMTREFELVKTVVVAVDDAWNTLESTLAGLEREAADLQTQAETLDINSFPELTAAQQKLAALRAWVASDPLGVTADIAAEVRPLLQSLRAKIVEIQHQQDALASDLARARALLAELNALNGQCQDALTETQTKIGNPTGLRAPLPKTTLADLSTWLDTIQAARTEKRPQAARVGLDRWLAHAQNHLAAERAACTANRAPLETRAELRGRLSSLKIKAKAYAARGLSLAPGLTTLARQAEDALGHYPLDLDAASAIVSRYEDELSKIFSQAATRQRPRTTDIKWTNSANDRAVPARSSTGSAKTVDARPPRKI